MLALVLLPAVVSGLTAHLQKPTKAQLAKRMQWKVATVAADWESSNLTSVSQPDDKGVIRPRMEILETSIEVGGSKTVEVFWQRPNTTKINGIFFGATGCFHQGGDFFEQVDPVDGWEFKACHGSKMMRCQGLPDNVYSFKYALERGYLVMTVTPQDKNSCWNHALDPKRVDHAVKYVIQTEALDTDIKMFATGASQGGYFMFDMQEKNVRNLACIAPQCAEMKWKTKHEHLPTMMIWMPKDVNLTNPIRETIDYLQKRGVRVAERTPHAWKFHELMRARGYPEETVEKVRERLQHSQGEFGHKPVTKGGHIIDHPGTDTWWTRSLRYVFTEKEDSFLKDHSKIHHLMQVAFAEHEYTAEYTDHIIDFCEGHEDANAPLRFNRKVELIEPSPAAIACSPNCAPPNQPLGTPTLASLGSANFGKQQQQMSSQMASMFGAPMKKR